MGSFLDHQKRRVVLVPFPLQGHMTPMLQLGSILHSKGFSITVAHPEFNSPNPLNHPKFVFVPLADNFMSEAGSDSDQTASFMMNSIHYIGAMNENCRQPLVDYLVQSDHQISCIIYDAIMFFGEAVASQLKIPSIFLSIFSATYLQSWITIRGFHAENRFPIPDWQLDNPVPGLDSLRFKDLPVRVSSAFPDVRIQLLDSFTNIKSSAAIICNTTDDLELSSITQLSQRHNVPFFPIGPFHKMAPSSTSSSTSYTKEDSACIPWLDKQAPNSVLYLSKGSLATINKKELVETAWGLENSGQPFLWVIRSSSSSLLLLPKGFQERVGERGLIVKWAPQREVLAHPAVGGFLSHCGWNSTLESIFEAVPMICRPCFSDQIVNSRYLTHVWKVGLELDHDSDRRVIEKTIRKLMVDNDQGKEMRDRMLDLKRKMESSVQQGGSSYTSLNNLVDFISSLP